MPRSEVFTIYYQSRKKDGSLWCESRSLSEVIEQSEGEDVTYSRMVVTKVYGDWENMGKLVNAEKHTFEK